MTDSRLRSILTLSGTLPFVACAVLPLFGVTSLAPIGELSAVAAGYGFGIISFLCGAHWAMAFDKSPMLPINLTAGSNAIFLVTFFAYIGAGIAIALAVQIGAFLSLLAIDHRLWSRELISKGYFRLRIAATAVAVISLAFIALNPSR